ncbi:MAG: L,D-transpeptidase family protein [Anaerolineae bacterium]|nr:L,D-transpeptidase family protein [Anaerolineae bacterium]
MSTIANAYGVNWVALAQANSISAPYVIHTGQVLSVPNPTLTPPADYGAPPGTAPSNNRWIHVQLSTQTIRAYEGDQLVREVTVSTGLPGTPTVQGDYYIYTKLPAQTMSGPGYYLPGVPWVMYFYRGYAIHGTYWHNNFGQPMSHGCVNLPTEEAAWFYNFASIGTLVRVVY